MVQIIEKSNRKLSSHINPKATNNTLALTLPITISRTITITMVFFEILFKNFFLFFLLANLPGS